MVQNKDFSQTIDAVTASTTDYDVVIVGSGIAGSIIAKELTKGEPPLRVLVVEAGLGNDLSQDGYQRYLETFYSAVSKDNNSPYPRNPNAEMPRGPDVKALRPGQPNTDGYWVQHGPFVSDSVYARVLGGTTMHWEGKTIRMLREDFEMRSRFGQGLDWPIKLDDLFSYYRQAEYEIGVSGNANAQRAVGVEYGKNDLYEKEYVYPMKEMPASYLDNYVAGGLSGMKLKLDGRDYPLWLTTFPQGRNGVPEEAYKKFDPTGKSEPYDPDGAVTLHQSEQGERCQGNTACVPGCPIQSKYDARKTLRYALKTGGAHLLTQAVASAVRLDSNAGAVTEIELKLYGSKDSPVFEKVSVRGKVFVLAANAVENARLMLASSLHNNCKVNPLIGRNLMDHPYLLTWGLLPKAAGIGRGPLVTSGICNLRSGSFRRQQAAFAVDIHNDGWGWATGSPINDLVGAIDDLNKYGDDLRQELVNRISRQLLLATMIEMLPQPDNRVTVDGSYTDAIGNMRPVISYKIPDYSLASIETARNLAKALFQRMGAADCTCYSPLDYGYVNYNGAGYAIRGGNHLAGTHIMGTARGNSVVDSYQKSWDHHNLYLVGAGSMPTIGSSNTTLTIAALCFRTAEVIRRRFTEKLHIELPRKKI
ncbi:MAG: Glucose-methanol-choline oxidoreductase:NAD binding site [Verrucomicrobiales bacterium]|nr:Glucose-methanol-choline oxidoreductase:NAD binding site [Verrucomicrobiales bacterium]